MTENKPDAKLLTFYKNKTVLVTGSSGYIGSALIASLKKLPCQVIALTHGSDIRNRRTWREFVNRVDTIFHLAAQTSAAYAADHPIRDLTTNLIPIVHLLELCQKYSWRPAILLAGTVTQVGLTKKIPVNESFPDKPCTVYDINKLAAEKYLQYYSSQLGGRAVTLRLANVYGPGPASGSSDRGVVNSMVRKAIGREPLTIYGTGTSIRDYIYIDDTVSAFLVAAASPDRTNGKYYIVGTGIGHSIKQMAETVRETVAKHTGFTTKIVYKPWPKNTRPIEKRNFIAGSRSFTRDTGWRAKVNFTTGIDRTVRYFLRRGVP